MRLQAAPFQSELNASPPLSSQLTLSLLLLANVRESHVRTAQLCIRARAGGIHAVAIFGLLDDDKDHAANADRDNPDDRVIQLHQAAREGDAAAIVGSLVHVSPRCFYAAGQFDPPSLAGRDHEIGTVRVPVLTAHAVNVRAQPGGFRLVDDLVLLGGGRPTDRGGIGGVVANAPRAVGALGARLRRPVGGIVGDCAVVVGGDESDVRPGVVLVLGDGARGRRGPGGVVVCPGDFGGNGDFAVARLERADCGDQTELEQSEPVWRVARVDFFSVALSRDSQTSIPPFP
jgi:hypothetical protein